MALSDILKKQKDALIGAVQKGLSQGQQYISSIPKNPEVNKTIQRANSRKSTGMEAWRFNRDGSRKSFDELSNAEVMTWIGTMEPEKQKSARLDFETNYLKNPSSRHYDPYYTEWSNNDEARTLFGVDVFDQKWIDENRAYLNHVTFSNESYSSPKKPGKNATELEKAAYAYWQIANTYEATTQAAESEYAKLRGEIQDKVKAAKAANRAVTADELLEGIDWEEYETLENLRKTAKAGNGRYLNRPVQVGEESLRAMVNAAIRGEDVTDARDYIMAESDWISKQPERMQEAGKTAIEALMRKMTGANEETQAPAEDESREWWNVVDAFHAANKRFGDTQVNKFQNRETDSGEAAPAEEVVPSQKQQGGAESTSGTIAETGAEGNTLAELLQNKPYSEQTHEKEELPVTTVELLTPSERVNEYRADGNSLRSAQTMVDQMIRFLSEKADEDADYREALVQWEAERDILMAERMEREKIAERVRQDSYISDFSSKNPLTWYWKHQFTDALNDADYVPMDDYETYLEYRANMGVKGKGTDESMAKYDRMGAWQERLSLLAEGFATGMNEAAKAGVEGLEYVLYTIDTWNPATKGMTKDEIYASNRYLSALKSWNEQYSKDVIDQETKAELTAEYPVFATVSAGTTEMLKMYGQMAGGLPFLIPNSSLVGKYGINTLQQGGPAAKTLAKLGTWASQKMPFALDTFGSAYETAINEGATENEAAGAAAINALATGYLSSVTVGELGKLGGKVSEGLKRLFSSGAGNKAAVQGAITAAKSGKINAVLSIGRNLGLAALEEGAEEAIEEPIQSGISKIIYDQDRAWTGEGGVFDPAAMVESGLMGAVAGSLFTITSGISGALGKPAQNKAEQLLEKTLNGEEVTQQEIDELTEIEAREASIQDKADELMEAAQPEIDAAAEKAEAAAEQTVKAEEKAEAAQEKLNETKKEIQPTLDGLNKGTLSYESPETVKTLNEAAKKAAADKGAIQQARAEVEQMKAAQEQAAQELDETRARVQETARAEATNEVDQEIAEEKAQAEQQRAEAEEAAKKAELERPVTPGVVYQNKGKKKLSPENQAQINVLDALGREYGIEFDIVESIEGSKANAAYNGGKRITVALDAAEGAYLQAGAHELTHYVKAQSGDGWAALETVVLDHLKKEGFELDSEIEKRIEEYRQSGHEIDREGAIEEIVAEAVPTIFTDENAAARLVERNPTLAESIRDFIRRFAQKLDEIISRYVDRSERKEISYLYGSSDALYEIAETLDGALEMARDNWTGTSSTEIELNNASKYSYKDRKVIEGYLEAVDPKILEAAQTYRKDKGAKFGRYQLGEVQEREVRDIKDLLGIDVSGYTHNIDKNGFNHIEKRHGENGKSDRSMADLNDVARMNWILDNYDTVEIGYDDKGNVKRSEGYRSSNDEPATNLVYKKKINGTYYLVEAVADNKWKKLWVVSAYINKKGTAQAPDAEAPGITSDNGVAPIPDVTEDITRQYGETPYASFLSDNSIISDSSENVNAKLSAKTDSQEAHDQLIEVMTGQTQEALIEEARAEEKAGILDDARRLAKRVTRDWKSGIDRAELVDGIDEITDAYQEGEEAKAEQLADELARKVIEQSRQTTTEHRQGYEEIRKRLRETKIRLTDTQMQEVINRYGSYGDFRKSLFGSVTLSKEGTTSLDSLWSEMSGMHPEMFPEGTNEAQMPEVLAEFVQQMRPRYENPYEMSMETASADLSIRLQAEIQRAMGREDAANQLTKDADALRASSQVQAQEKKTKQREKKIETFRQLAREMAAARDAGNDEELQKVIDKYRQSHGESAQAAMRAGAVEIGIQVRKTQADIRRMSDLINRISDEISNEDMDVNRRKLIAEMDALTETRDQLIRLASRLHRQEAITRLAADAVTEEADWQADGAEMYHALNEDMKDAIGYMRDEMTERLERLKGAVEARSQAGRIRYNTTTTITHAELAASFEDLEGEMIQHAGLANTWKNRKETAEYQNKAEQDQLKAFRHQLRQAEEAGDTVLANTMWQQILESENRMNVLQSQQKLADAQEKYCKRIGAKSLDEALTEGKLPQPIMERVIAMCAEAGRKGAWNNKALVKGIEAIRLNATTAARVYDDLFGEYAPLMRAIYYDQVMDNETTRTEWIASWRKQIAELKLTKKESELVQKIGERKNTPDEMSEASQKVLNAVEVFRQFYNEAHALAGKALTRNGYDAPGYISDYFPHLDTEKSFWEKLGFQMDSGSLPTSINGLTETFSPGKQYSSHLEHRTGEATSYDALAGFEEYIGSISGVIFHTDDIQRHRQLEAEIRAAAKNGVFGPGSRGHESDHLSEFVKWVHEYTNLLAGKKSIIDRPFEGTLGRPIYTAATRLKGIKGASAVMGNLSSAVTNMVPVTQIIAEHPIATLKGVGQLVKSTITGKGNIPTSQYMTRKYGSDSVVKTGYSRFSKGASWAFEAVDMLATNLVVNAYYQNNLDMGMDNETAMRSADAQAARLMGDRSKGAMPNIYGSQVMGFFTQFQLEVANQSQHFRKDIWREKSYAKALWTVFASALTGWVWNNVNEKLTGRRPAADPIQMVMDIYETATETGEALPVIQATYNNVSEMFPYMGGGRIAAFESVSDFMEAAFTEGNDISDIAYSTGQLAYSMLPMGGQIKKMVRGVWANKRGGYYNASGTQLYFPVADDPWTKAQAVLFGPTSIEAGRAYYAGDAEKLSKSRTEDYEQYRKRGASSTEAYENETSKAAADRLESDAKSTENAVLEAEALERAGEEFEEVDISQVESQKDEAKKLREDAMPGDMLSDFWWERRDTNAVKNGIQIWRETGDDWALPYAYEPRKSYTIDKRKEYLGEALAREADAMYEAGYMEIMDGVDLSRITEDERAELQEMLEDLYADVNKEMKERIKKRNAMNERKESIN